MSIMLLFNLFLLLIAGLEFEFDQCY